MQERTGSMAITKPLDVICDKWEPVSAGSKACRYYLKPGTPHDEMVLEKQGPSPSGLCSLPSEMLCVEWVRRNGTAAQQQALGVPALVKPIPPPPKPKIHSLATPFGQLDVRLPDGFKPAKEIDPLGLEALERAGVEVELSAPYLGDGGFLAIVHTRTGRTDRDEITFREAAVLRLIVDAFPGAHVVGYKSAHGVPSTAKNVASGLPRGVDGNIDNCALANGDSQDNCQMCRGLCPDASRFGRMVLGTMKPPTSASEEPKETEDEEDLLS